MCTYTSLIAFSLWLNSRRGSWKEGSERDRDQMECMMAESWIIPGWYPQLVWMSQLQCFHGLKMLALLNFLDRQVYVHTHAFDCEKDYNDWKHLWSGAHQRYCCSEKKNRHIMWFWIVPRLWHYQGCYLKDIACRNKVEVIPEGVLRIGVGHKDVSKI